jgi:hypothetical protein
MTEKTKNKKKSKTEVYENPYFGKKKPSGIMTRTWDVTSLYTSKKKKKYANEYKKKKK